MVSSQALLVGCALAISSALAQPVIPEGYGCPKGHVCIIPIPEVKAGACPPGAVCIIPDPEYKPEGSETTPKPDESGPAPIVPIEGDGYNTGTTPSKPEETPKTPEETPKTPEETPKAPEETPKAPEETPKTPEETPKASEETPKTPEDTPKPDAPATGDAADYKVTAEQLIEIAPETKACDAKETECVDAAGAAPALSAAFEKYGISSKGAQAALIAITLFESVGWKYNHNMFPGRPGQGTRNMQMPEFNKEYATELFGAEKVAAAGDVDGVLKLVQGDNESFGSAAWYLTKKCEPSVLESLGSGSDQAWSDYLTKCINTEHDPARDPTWTAAKKALGVK